MTKIRAKTILIVIWSLQPTRRPRSRWCQPKSQRSLALDLSLMIHKPLYSVICSVIFIVALKKCAVVLMLISHFIVDEDWKLSCCRRLTWQAFWQRGEKSHLCQWKQSKMEANVTIKVAKERERGRHSSILSPNAGRGMAWRMKRKWWGAQRRRAPDEMIAG